MFVSNTAPITNRPIKHWRTDGNTKLCGRLEEETNTTEPNRTGVHLDWTEPALTDNTLNINVKKCWRSVCVCVCDYILSRFLATCICRVFSEQKFWYSSSCCFVMLSWFFWYHCCFSCSSWVSWTGLCEHISISISHTLACACVHM